MTREPYTQTMNLKAKILSPAQAMIFYELIPPRAGAAQELEGLLTLCRELTGTVDAINIPEIYEESRRESVPGRKPLPERIEPRAFAKAIQTTAGIESVVNRVTVHHPEPAQLRWMRETYTEYGIRNLILVGGESRQMGYPGPSVVEAAKLSRQEGLDFLLGGITIPSRSHEQERVRQKYAQGLSFFTTQVLLDSNDIVDLIQGLNGLDVRIFLSFAPISNRRDLEFLKWLGVDVPNNVVWAVEQGGDAAMAVEKSTSLASAILTDVFDNLPAHPPALGINIEQITRRNFGAARQMLAHLGPFYRRHLQTRYPGATGDCEPASLFEAPDQATSPKWRQP
ncbi:MAG: hypothetical protein A3G20_08760 [Acidobacteria bacterium RIFCSPLOWO2_12_FULL_59_11]|nr:MAG: hypothetical protein A3G20_08760 [Acidobacteria bacterium RIFCSPLOWO2_12_FULL_59_11]